MYTTPMQAISLDTARGTSHEAESETTDAQTFGTDAPHNSVIRTLITPTGQVTLIVTDGSHWKAEALSAICDAGLNEVLARFLDKRPQADMSNPGSREGVLG